MKRIDSANVALNLFGPGKHGFQGGNPAANLPATFFTPEWANQIQEEISNVIENAGIVLDAGNRAQLLQAIIQLNALPSGAEVDWGAPQIPSGFLALDGAAIPVASAPNLVANVYCGDANNATASFYYRCNNPLDPANTRSTVGAYIVLKDARGRFARGFSNGSSLDAGRSLWQYQGHAMQDHAHGSGFRSSSPPGVAGGSGGSSFNAGPTDGVSGASVAGENRPDNYPSIRIVKV